MELLILTKNVILLKLELAFAQIKKKHKYDLKKSNRAKYNEFVLFSFNCLIGLICFFKITKIEECV